MGSALDQNLTRIGLGYGIATDLVVYAGLVYDVFYTRSMKNYNAEYRTWQQLSWGFYQQPTYELSLRTRMEQRFRQSASGTAWRIRELFEMTFPNLIHHTVSLVINDEIFLNINTLTWVSHHTFAQNRVLMAFEFPIAHGINLTVGYLNQYLRRSANHEMNHILYLSLHI